MIVHETDNYIIFCPRYKIVSSNVTEEIYNLINSNSSDKSVAIDMSSVYSVSSEFLNMLNSFDGRITLLNCCAEILVLLNLTNIDKRVKLFTSLIDMEEDRRELRNRKFSLV